MTATSHPEFGAGTEAIEVAEALADSVRGRTILVTGVSRGGIGFATSQALASQGPACLIAAGRNTQKVQESVDALKQEFPDVNYRILELDLSRQTAVRAAAAVLLSWEDVPTIDILINNAAVMNLPEQQLTEEGIELTFATNHIGHYLFTCLIIPKLQAAAKDSPSGITRIINVSSLSPTRCSMRWSDINQMKVCKTLPAAEQPNYEMHRLFGAVDPEEKSYLPLEGYNQSKVANVLCSIALNRRLYDKYGILSLACHPGVIQTELGRYATAETRTAIQKALESGFYATKTLGAGASTTLVAALDPTLGAPVARREDGKENVGIFLMDCQISDSPTPGASSSTEAEKLWSLSESLVKEKFAW